MSLLVNLGIGVLNDFFSDVGVTNYARPALNLSLISLDLELTWRI